MARAVNAGAAPRSAAPAPTPTRRASEGGRPKPTLSLARRVGVAIPRSHGPRGNAVFDALRRLLSAGVAGAEASTPRFVPWGFGNDPDRTKTAGAGETSDAAAALAPVCAGPGELCAPVLRIFAHPEPGTRASTEVIDSSRDCVNRLMVFSGSFGKSRRSRSEPPPTARRTGWRGSARASQAGSFAVRLSLRPGDRGRGQLEDGWLRRCLGHHGDSGLHFVPIRCAICTVLIPGPTGRSELPIVDEGPLCGRWAAGHGIVHRFSRARPRWGRWRARSLRYYPGERHFLSRKCCRCEKEFDSVAASVSLTNLGL